MQTVILCLLSAVAGAMLGILAVALCGANKCGDCPYSQRCD